MSNIDIERLAPQLLELKDLLLKGDMDAVILLTGMKNTLSAVDPRLTGALLKKLDVFDFKGAILDLAAIQESLEKKKGTIHG